MFTFDAPALREFFGQVPRLFAAEDGRVRNAYQGLLYTIEHPLADSTTDAVEAAFHLAHPAWNPESRSQAIAMLDRLRYPETRPISELRAVAGLDLCTLSHYLHFVHHAYPIYTRQSCAGLARLGAHMPYTKVRDPDVYGLYIAAIDQLKERIPYWDVPETNVYLTRIVQGALHEYGQKGDGNGDGAVGSHGIGRVVRQNPRPAMTSRP